jgi:Heparinase II/III N-terminus/Heparinase II/III-like protein
MTTRLLVVSPLFFMAACAMEQPQVDIKPAALPVTAPSAPANAAAAVLAPLDDPTRHGTDAAIRWDLRAPWLQAPSLKPLGRDGAIVFWARPTASVGRLEITAVIGGANPRSGTITLAGGGWRRIYLPMRALEAAPQGTVLPDGATFSLTAVKPPVGKASVDLAGLEVVGPGMVSGPSLSDDDLLAQIDWSLPGLAAGRDLLAAGDRRGALAALAAYVRQRPRTWPGQALKDDATANADRVLRGEVGAVGLKHTFADGRIDWLANPTSGDSATSEWIWSLNRHADWVTMAQAYKNTGKSTYTAGWSRLLRSWAAHVPAPALADEKAGSAWRDIETGLRMTMPWFDSFYTVLDDPSVSDQDILLFMKSVWDHGNFLSVATFNPSNHFIFAMTGLYTAGAQFPEFREAGSWRTIAGKNLERSLKTSTLDEGGWYELSPGYGSWVCNKMLDTWDTASAAGQTAELTPLLREKLRKMAEWGTRLVAPDGTVPMLNDGGALTLAAMNLPRAVARFPESEMLLWANQTAAGQPATPPSWTSEYLPDSGYMTMRTGWGRQDSYVLLDAGPLGGWHGHQDALNLVTWFNGRQFLFDNGGHKYDASIWRKWGMTTAAHNTVLVDDLGQIRNWDNASDPIGSLPKDQPAALFGTSPQADYASGWYVCGYGKDVAQRGKVSSTSQTTPATHRREVLLVKSGAQPVTIVLDTLTPGDAQAHRYEVRWHLKTKQWASAENGTVTWTTDAGQPNLAVIALGDEDTCLADSGVEKPQPLGWWFENQNSEPTPALTLRRQRQVTGQTRLLTILMPFQGMPANPVTSIKSLGKEAWSLQGRDGTALIVRIASNGLQPSITVDGITMPAVH